MNAITVLTIGSLASMALALTGLVLLVDHPTTGFTVSAISAILAASLTVWYWTDRWG